MKYLIVEDERLAADRLCALIGELDEQAEIVGRTISVHSSVEWLRKNPQPDLIFMDIHLEDDICFGIFDVVHINVPVIFTSAYDQYALRAFQSNGVAYLLKPIDKEALRQSLQRLSTFSRTAESEAIRSAINAFERKEDDRKTGPIRRITFKMGDTLETMPIEDVAYFYSEDHYTFVVSRDNKRSIISPSLEEIDARIDHANFIRVSRNAIVSVGSVEKVTRILGRLKLKLRPDFKQDLYVARARTHDFMEWMGLS